MTTDLREALIARVRERLTHPTGAGDDFRLHGDYQLGCDIVEALSSSTADGGDERGWLIEENASGFIHWIALAKDEWPMVRVTRRSDSEIEHYRTPVVRVKDANEAIRFARKVDADAFIALFDRFLLFPVATEHAWPKATLSAADRGEGDRLREALAYTKETLRLIFDGSPNRVRNGPMGQRINTAMHMIESAPAALSHAGGGE